jgi:hypothetical protein
MGISNAFESEDFGLLGSAFVLLTYSIAIG